MLVFHGLSDGVFSPDDTAAWYDRSTAAWATAAARCPLLPRDAGHGALTRGGPSTDQFDGLQALVDWVEKGVAPERIVASARAEPATLAA